MFHVRALSIAGLLGLILLLPTGQANADQNQARKLFEKMQHAAHTLDYRGVFVYQDGSALSTLKIDHAWYKGKAYERLVSQDGARREVLVNGDLVTYVRPSNKSVVIMRRDSRPVMPSRFGSKALPTSYYHLQIGSSKRIAGQACRMLMLKPADRYRYEHRMCVDIDNSLPLESEVIDRQGRAVERMLFTNIQLDSSLKPAFFKPPVLGPHYTLRWVKTNVQRGSEGKEGIPWNIKSTVLPPGFVLRATQMHRFSADGDPVCHFILSDGVATVSVFIASNVHRRDFPASTMERSGALNVLTTGSHGALITVMGEVPRITVQRIADAVRYSKAH